MEAKFNECNRNSERVLLKVGMQKEGVFKDSRLFNGQLVNDVQYAITKHQYNELKQ
ncbi:hypothetical protein JCM19045_1704 [Bacillus sp. JCM 19045]|nr:hypothetical protein JCM19045_1704 [Bacillus sp. JCM 19045]